MLVLAQMREKLDGSYAELFLINNCLMMTMTTFIGLKGLESRKYVNRKGVAAGKWWWGTF